MFNFCNHCAKEFIFKRNLINHKCDYAPKESDFCSGENGYSGPKDLEYLYLQGLNPRCGRPLSECDEGLGHVHLLTNEELKKEIKKMKKIKKLNKLTK